jgi:tetratricopeptide (TPR) repeat protein
VDKDLEEILFQKLRENPLDFNTLNKLGYIYLHSNNLLKSEEFYVRSIKTDSKQFEPYVSLGLIYTITLRLGKALYYLLKAMDENSESPELLKSIEEINSAILNKYSNLSDEKLDELANDGLKMLESGNNEEAIENYLILSKLLPDNEPALINLCISLIRNQDYKIAEIILDDYISKKSSSGLINHYAGIVANFMGKFDKAEMYLTKSLELKPSLADIVSNGKKWLLQKRI